MGITPVSRDIADQSTLPHRTASEQEHESLVLRVEFSPDPEQRGRVVPLAQDVLWIGRRVGEDHFMVGHDRSVSRVHAAVQRAGSTGYYQVKNLKSRNGTRVDGQAVDQKTIRAGQVIRIGDTVLLVSTAREGSGSWHAPGRSGMVGRSTALRQVLEEVEKIAPTGICALVTGPTGVGKELVAQYLHTCSACPGPFVAVNCAALRPELAASELFGHVRGAFSGADQDQTGLFASAGDGTLFLDEVGELLPNIQAQLLRAVEEREVRPVGAVRPVPFRARVVSATNVDLEGAVRHDRFRSDLYARLAQWVIHVPPLHLRRGDIIPLAEHFLSETPGDPPFSLTADVAEALLIHGWPRNVRELAAVIRQMTLEQPGGGALDRLPSTLSRLPTEQSPIPPSLRSDGANEGVRRGPPTREELEQLLSECQGCVTDVAQHLGLHRVQVHRWIKRHGLDAARYRR